MLHIFRNKLKILLRSKAMIFWTMIFPIALAFFFNMAFSNITKAEKFEPVKIGVVESQAFEDETAFRSLIKETSKNNDDQVFKTTYYDTDKKAEKALEDNDIAGYYTVKGADADTDVDENDIEIVIKKNGIDQTIMKQVVDQYYQTYEVTGTLVEHDPASVTEQTIKDINSNKTYFHDVSNKNVDSTVIYFYTLIGMACMYAGLFGIEAVKESETNLSTIAARNSVSPTHKLKHLVASLGAGFLIQYIEILVLLAFMIFVLGIAFGEQTGYIVILTCLATLAGISFGTMIGSCNRRSENAKVGILISVTMLCCMLGGMMAIDLRFVIKESLPVLDAINPVTMITDGLFALYCYDDFQMYNLSLIKLAVFSAVMIVISYFFVRRKKYDSI